MKKEEVTASSTKLFYIFLLIGSIIIVLYLVFAGFIVGVISLTPNFKNSWIRANIRYLFPIQAYASGKIDSLNKFYEWQVMVINPDINN